MADSLTSEDYGQLYQMLTSADTAQRAAALQMSSKLTPDEAQQFFDFQHTANRPDLNQRADSDMVNIGGMGISPEMALGVGQAGRAVVGAARAGGAMAGARTALAQAEPVVKYELTRTALTSMGVPGPLATAAAMAVSGYTGRGNKAATKVTTTAAEPATVPGTGTAWTPGETPPMQTSYTVTRPPGAAAPPTATTTGMTPGSQPSLQTSYTVARPQPPAPAPARPASASSTGWTPGAAPPVQTSDTVVRPPPPAEPPPTAPAPVQSAPVPAPGPAPAAPVPSVTLPAQAAQSALVQTAARARIPLTKAELDAMVPHVVAGNSPDDVLAALVKLRQEAPAAGAARAGAAAAQARPAQVDVAGNVPASRSRRGIASATPGLTVADVEALGLNPALPIKKLTPDMVARVMRSRAERAALYRSDAAYKKSIDAMVASERD